MSAPSLASRLLELRSAGVSPASSSRSGSGSGSSSSESFAPVASRREIIERIGERRRKRILPGAVRRESGSVRTVASLMSGEDMPERLERPPHGMPDIPGRLPNRELLPAYPLPEAYLEARRRGFPAGSESLHSTSTQSVSSLGIRHTSDLVDANTQTGINPDPNPFVMSLWTYVAGQNKREKNCTNCSVVGNVGKRDTLARKIKKMSLNPTAYGNKYSVLGSS